MKPEPTTPAWIFALRARLKEEKSRKAEADLRESFKTQEGRKAALKGFVKHSRRTPAERAMQEILDRYYPGFIPQRIVGNSIADFMHPKDRIIIEIDGEYHFHRGKEDAARTKRISSKGFIVVRFVNHDVLNRPQNVIEAVTALRGPEFAIRCEDQPIP